MILHADIDAFFASVEQVRDPALRGRPVVVGGLPDEASVIASCSYEARRFGLHAGMPLRRARRLCPEAVFLTGSYPEYRRASERVFGFLRELSPLVEVVSLDEAYVDLRGAEHLHGGVWRAARTLRGRVYRATGLRVSVGIGPSRIVARLATACAKPDGIGMIFPARVPAFLERLPLEALPGIGRKTRALLSSLNLERVGDLARLPPELLEATLGRRGRTLRRLARGEDLRPLEPGRGRRPHTVSRCSALHTPSADPEVLWGYLYYLCERLGLELRRIGARARILRVLLEYADYKRRAGAVRLAEPTDLDRLLFEAARARFLRLFDRRVQVRRVGVAASGLLFTPERQELLLDLDGRRRLRRLLGAVETIRRRYGFHKLVCGPSVALLGRLEQNEHGFVLRTASLTR